MNVAIFGRFVAGLGFAVLMTAGWLYGTADDPVKRKAISDARYSRALGAGSMAETQHARQLELEIGARKEKGLWLAGGGLIVFILGFGLTVSALQKKPSEERA